MNILTSWLAQYLNQPVRNYQTYGTSPLSAVSKIILPGDVILVDGDRRISSAIKYLTQSTWSHAAVYVGDIYQQGGEDPCVLVEAELKEGVILSPLSKFQDLHIRICRPINLTDDDLQTLITFLIERIGYHYDLKNIIDLVRYLLPTPPVPVRWRRRMIALGSGDPTRAICSTLIAQAFQHIRYPILPEIEIDPAQKPGHVSREILHIRHHSLFTPRDFDISPYFEIVKPCVRGGFNYKQVNWGSR